MLAMGRLLTIFIVALIATLAGPAFSQKKSAEDLAIEEKRQKEIDEAYKSAVDRTKERGPARAADPWGNVREPIPPQGKSKAPAKTGTP